MSLRHRRKSHRLALAMACVLPVLSVRSASAQHAPGTLTDAYARARAVVDAAVTAHGGLDALGAARHMRVTMSGHDVWRNQGLRADPPYTREPYTVDLMIDMARAQLISTTTATYPGGIHRATRFITNGEQGYGINLRRMTYGTSRYPPPERQSGNLVHLPQFWVLAAHANPASLRWIGRMRLSSGAEVDAIALADADGLITLGFDPATRLLRARMHMTADMMAGDAAVEHEFLDYRMLNGVLMPTRRTTRVAGELTREYTYTSVTPNYVIPDSLLTAPAGATESRPTPAADPVRELANGVWAVQAAGYWSLAVAFRDHVLVVDAPANGVPDVIARVGTLAPGKPIRFVVPTHHHDDHAGGIRDYAAAGATIVTTPGNRGFFQKLLAAPPSTLTPAGSRPATTAPNVEIITDKRRVFTDGARTVEIHDIGPSPHADEMLVAWLPAEGILFQGDLIDAPPDGSIPPGTNNETTMHFGAWLRSRGWNLRTFAGTHGFLPEPATFEALLRQPLLPMR